MLRRPLLFIALLFASLIIIGIALPVVAQTATPVPTVTLSPFETATFTPATALSQTVSPTFTLTATLAPFETAAFTPSTALLQTASPTLTPTITLTSTSSVTQTAIITATATTTVTLSAEETQAKTAIRLKWIDFWITIPPLIVSIALAWITSRKKEEGRVQYNQSNAGGSITGTILSLIVGIGLFILLAVLYVIPNRTVTVTPNPVMQNSVQEANPIDNPVNNQGFSGVSSVDASSQSRSLNTVPIEPLAIYASVLIAGVAVGLLLPMLKNYLVPARPTTSYRTALGGWNWAGPLQESEEEIAFLRNGMRRLQESKKEIELLTLRIQELHGRASNAHEEASQRELILQQGLLEKDLELRRFRNHANLEKQQFEQELALLDEQWSTSGRIVAESLQELYRVQSNLIWKILAVAENESLANPAGEAGLNAALREEDLRRYVDAINALANDARKLESLVYQLSYSLEPTRKFLDLFVAKRREARDRQRSSRYDS